MRELVISAIGPDRPGLVDELTASISNRDANVADSRMVNLRGEFAVVMLVEVADDVAETLRNELVANAEKAGLRANVKVVGQDGEADAPAVPYRIRTYSMDQVGLVHRITHALHVLKVNIEELTTRLEHGPHSGTPLFSMDMIVSVPEGVPLKNLRDALEGLCAELNCDLDIDRA